MGDDQRDGVEKWARWLVRLVREAAGWPARIVTAGLTLTTYGALMFILFLFKPWASCPDDSIPAACPSTSAETAILLASTITIAIGGVVAASGIAATYRRKLAARTG